MRDFEHVQDVEEWLEPMGYDEFFVKLSPYGVDAEIRADCETSIANGASQDTVLSVIKSLMRIELTKELGLERRPITPWVQLVK
jgi:histidyl-tRNA synthetase